MQKKLSKLADIVSGYTFRGPVEGHSNGDITVLQAKNIQINQEIVDVSGFATISDKSLRSPYLLQRGDILLVSRGLGAGSFRAAFFAVDEKKVMASSSVHVIRTKDVTVIPKYILLYLNSELGQRALSEIVTGGSYIRSILVKNLNELEIPIPPIHTQKSIIALHENITGQERILKRKQELQKNIINASFANLINS